MLTEPQGFLFLIQPLSKTKSIVLNGTFLFYSQLLTGQKIIIGRDYLLTGIVFIWGE